MGKIYPRYQVHTDQNMTHQKVIQQLYLQGEEWYEKHKKQFMVNYLDKARWSLELHETFGIDYLGRIQINFSLSHDKEIF